MDEVGRLPVPANLLARHTVPRRIGFEHLDALIHQTEINIVLLGTLSWKLLLGWGVQVCLKPRDQMDSEVEVGRDFRTSLPEQLRRFLKEGARLSEMIRRFIERREPVRRDQFKHVR